MYSRKYKLKDLNENYKIIFGHLCLASAKVWNIGLYEKINYEKLDLEEYPSWYEQKKRLKDSFWNRNLPSQSSQNTLKRLSDAVSSYFSALKEYEKDSSKFTSKPKFPKYKKDNFNVVFENNGFKVISNKIRLSIPKQLRTYLKEKFNIKDKFIFLDIPNLKNKKVKIVEIAKLSIDEYEVYIAIENTINKQKCDNNNYMAIDIGMRNLLSVYSNVGDNFIIKGSPFFNIVRDTSIKIKTKQQIYDDYQNFHNKKEIKTKLKKSKKIISLYNKRTSKIKDFIHKATSYVVSYAVENNINTVIIGDLKNIRQNFNDNNSKTYEKEYFNLFPSLQLKKYLEYKLKEKGIRVIFINEAYTSSVSPYSKGISKKYQNKDYRKCRGLFVIDNQILNADIVGAFNILRKYLLKENMNINLKYDLDKVNQVKLY